MVDMRDRLGGVDMSTVKAYYDGVCFLPMEPVTVQKGVVVILQIASEGTAEEKIAAKLAAFRQLTNDIHETNETEPFPPVFDEILSNRVNFARELAL